jgi:hypothetical protein
MSLVRELGRRKLDALLLPTMHDGLVEDDRVLALAA